MTTQEKSLAIVMQKQVMFYEDEITAVLTEESGNRQIYVPLRPISNFLGIAWDPQRRRILRDPVLSVEVKGITVTVTPGGPQEMVCLPLKYLPGWLFGITTQRVKSEMQEKIIRYQRECYDVLWEAFQEGRLTQDSTLEELLQSDSPAAQAYKMLQAMMKMARQQLILEAQLEKHAAYLNQHEQRLEVIEATLGNPGHFISSSQASQISQAVKAIALEMGKRTKKNEYGGVYGELYRRYQIPEYRLLPASNFEDAMKWLRDWYQSLTGTVPF